MADKNVYNEKDSMDINELASLNDDISPDLIDQLQAKLSNDAISFREDDNASNTPANTKDDATLFEETEKKEKPKSEVKKIEVNLDKKFDDNFIKKYKAKLNKQQEAVNKDSKKAAETHISSAAFSDNTTAEDNKNIEEISKGNIKERKFSKKQKEYNDSLDFLDNNVKYSKYVIYIDPENVPFIDSLTVKERKNLINKILREQDDIAITKQRFKIVNAVIKHVIIAIITVAISIPIIYFTINTSLEATINNYRRSQSLFQTLYKENGKVSNIRKCLEHYTVSCCPLSPTT